MSKIVIDARESGTSTGRYIDKLIEYLSKLPTTLDFIVITKPHRMAYIKKIAPSFGLVEANYKEFTFDEQLGLKKLIKSQGADLVHFGMVQQPVLYRGRSVTTIHDLTTARFVNPSKNFGVFKAKQQVYKKVIKSAAKRSVLVITPTEFVKNDLIDFTGQPKDKFIVTYESADFIHDDPEAIDELKNKQFIMYVGRPTPHKNLQRLIDSFSMVSKSHPELKLVLAGKKDFNYHKFESNVKSKKIKNIIFTDFISEGQLKWLYENCVAYVLPSLSEGFGLPGLEAMIHGAPLISSNATCLPEVYGPAAKYFDPLDVGDMTSAINEVVDNKDLREDLIKKGHLQAKKYSWKRMAEQTLDVYNKALKS